MEKYGEYLSHIADKLVPSQLDTVDNQSNHVPYGLTELYNQTWRTMRVNDSSILLMDSISGNESSLWSMNLSNNTWSTNSSDINQQGGTKWGALALAFLIVCTALGNTLVILAVCWERRLQNMTNYFLLSLAVADFLVSLLVMPLGMVVSLYDEFPFDPHLCAAWFTCDVLMCTASIWHMCTMSMDRYLTLQYPMKYGRNKTKSTVVIKIMCVWLISILITSPISIMGFMDTNNVYFDGLCAPRVDSFIIYGSIFAFYVPLVIMVITYVLTIRILNNNRKLAQAMGRHKKFSKGSMTTNNTNGYSNSESGSFKNGKSQGSMYLPRSSYPVIDEEKPCLNGDCGMSSPDSEPSSDALQMLVDRQKETTISSDSLSTSDSDRTFHNSDDSCSIDMKTFSLSVNNLRETDILSVFARVKSCPTLYTAQVRRLSRENENQCNKPNQLNVIGVEESQSDEIRTTELANIETLDTPQIAFTKELRLPKNNSEKDLLDWLERPKTHKTPSIIDEESSDAESSQEHSPLNVQNNHVTKETNTVDINKNVKFAGEEKMNGGSNPAKIAITVNKLSDAIDNRPPPELRIPVVTVSHHGDSVKKRISKTERKKFRTSICTMQPVQFELDKNLLHPPNSSTGTFSAVVEPDVDPRRNSFWCELNTYQEKNGIKRADSAPTMSLMRRVKRVRATTRRLLLTRAHQSNEQKASKVLGIIFAVFVILWTPFFFVNLLGGFCAHCVQAISGEIMTLFVWLGYIASLANPVIYTCFNTSFRRAFLRILKCHYITGKSSPHQTSSYVDTRYTERRFTAANISLK